MSQATKSQRAWASDFVNRNVGVIDIGEDVTPYQAAELMRKHIAAALEAEEAWRKRDGFYE